MILSIIIPVYNAAKYINQCIQSVVRQSYHDFECILIDDGSNDGSGELCDNWAGIDNRIKVIHQQNQGVSIARNKGIKIAQGKYIVFIDSDDWVEENYLEALMESNADYVISGIYIHNNNSRTEKIIPNSEITFILNSSAKNYIAQLFKRQLLFGPISKRYKLSIVKDYQIKFPSNISYGEDLLYNFEYLKYVKTITTVPQATYHYRCTENDTLSTIYRPNYWEINYHQWLKMYDYFNANELFISPISNLMYTRLWGIVYDSIFIANKIYRSPINIYIYIYKILSESIFNDKSFIHASFKCSKWIKNAIINRRSVLLTLAILYHNLMNKK